MSDIYWKFDNQVYEKSVMIGWYGCKDFVKLKTGLSIRIMESVGI